MQRIAKLALILAALAGTSMNTLGQTASKVIENSGFDFSYSVTGDKTLVLQAFDDGKRTYLSIPKNTPQQDIDAMRQAAIAGMGQQVWPIALQESQPFLAADGLFERLVISFDRRSVTIQYKGKRVRSAPPNVEPAPTPASENKAAAPSPKPADLPGVLITTEQPMAIPKLPVKTVLPEKKPNLERNAKAEKIDPQLLQSPFVEVTAPKVPEPAVAAQSKPIPPGQVEQKPLPKLLDMIEPPKAPAQPAPKAAKPDEKNGAGATEDVVHVIQIPFVVGKAALGKDGLKALDEVLEVINVATEVKIIVPSDPGAAGDEVAMNRIAELQKRLLRAGHTKIAYRFEVRPGAPTDKIVQAQVDLTITLPKREPEPESAHNGTR